MFDPLTSSPSLSASESSTSSPDSSSASDSLPASGSSISASARLSPVLEADEGEALGRHSLSIVPFGAGAGTGHIWHNPDLEGSREGVVWRSGLGVGDEDEDERERDQEGLCEAETDDPVVFPLGCQSVAEVGLGLDSREEGPRRGNDANGAEETLSAEAADLDCYPAEDRANKWFVCGRYEAEDRPSGEGSRMAENRVAEESSLPGASCMVAMRVARKNKRRGAEDRLSEERSRMAEKRESGESGRID